MMKHVMAPVGTGQATRERPNRGATESRQQCPLSITPGRSRCHALPANAGIGCQIRGVTDLAGHCCRGGAAGEVHGHRVSGKRAGRTPGGSHHRPIELTELLNDGQRDAQLLDTGLGVGWLEREREVDGVSGW